MSSQSDVNVAKVSQSVVLQDFRRFHKFRGIKVVLQFAQWIFVKACLFLSHRIVMPCRVSMNF